MSPRGKAQPMLPSKVNSQLLVSNGVSPFLNPQSVAVAPQQRSLVSGVAGATPTA